jgi:hypothetical protein
MGVYGVAFIILYKVFGIYFAATAASPDPAAAAAEETEWEGREIRIAPDDPIPDPDDLPPLAQQSPAGADPSPRPPSPTGGGGSDDDFEPLDGGARTVGAGRAEEKAMRRVMSGFVERDEIITDIDDADPDA